ncbi:energy transducer TonB [Halosquirtibacter xylanolyticus]|uniref:energy transducer TonB n=1 Tax=Halosquirtibacter xylanolyticus TaxID=3374599 RepID=UPI003748FCC5|nr:energy transducer TonB [Prolixibacteraceae bacterium]
MEPKKTPKADLESKRSTFVWLGLAVSLLAVWLAFAWTTEPKKTDSFGAMQQDDLIEDEIPITTKPETPPPPPPPPPPAEISDVITIVDDEEVIEDEMEIEESDDVDGPVKVETVVEDEKEAEEEEIFNFVEDMPMFPGGNAALLKYIGKTVKYPVIAQENGIQGRVFVTFVVEKDGSVTDVRIARGVDKALDREAVRVVKTLPRWKPGMQRGKAVRVSYSVPINFVLN